MNILSELFIPLLLTLCGAAVFRGTDVFSTLSSGAESGFKVVFGMLKTLIPLLAATSMLRASGFFELLASALSFTSLPPEIITLFLLRPLSGSAALASAGDIMTRFGVNSDIGRLAATAVSSCETTFFVVSLYFGSVKNIGKRREGLVLASSLVGDAAACAASYLFVELIKIF